MKGDKKVNMKNNLLTIVFSFLVAVSFAEPVRSMLGAADNISCSDGPDYDPTFPGLVLRLNIQQEQLTCGITITMGADGLIDWGDGTVEQYIFKNLVQHTYSVAGEYIVYVDNADGFNATIKSQILDILKWKDGITSLSAVTYRNLTNVRSIAGSDTIVLGDWTFADSFHTDFGDDTIIGPFPRTTNIGFATFGGAYFLKYVLLDGVLTKMDSTYSFSELGNRLVPDDEGFKGVIRVGNTCQSLLEVTGFPGGAPTSTKWICSDGVVAYRNSIWQRIDVTGELFRNMDRR